MRKVGKNSFCLEVNWNVVALLAAASPESCGAGDSAGRHALHWAVLKAAPLAVVRELLAVCPAAARRPCALGKLPLHYAAAAGAAAGVRAALAAAYPEGAHCTDTLGCPGRRSKK